MSRIRRCSSSSVVIGNIFVGAVALLKQPAHIFRTQGSTRTGRPGEPVVAEADAVSHDELVAWYRRRLAGYNSPRRIELPEQLSRSKAGKLQKRLLREPYWAERVG